MSLLPYRPYSLWIEACLNCPFVAMPVDLLYDMASTIESQHSVTGSARQNGPYSGARHANDFASNDIRIHDDGENERNQRGRECSCFVRECYWFSSSLLVPLFQRYSGRPLESVASSAVRWWIVEWWRRHALIVRNGCNAQQVEVSAFL